MVDIACPVCERLRVDNAAGLEPTGVPRRRDLDQRRSMDLMATPTLLNLPAEVLR